MTQQTDPAVIGEIFLLHAERGWSPKAIAELEREMPEIYAQLLALRDRLESHYHEVQDFEFTIERGRLYCLQTRNGKMNARAMVRTSVEMHRDGLISRERALLRVEPSVLQQLLVGVAIGAGGRRHADAGRHGDADERQKGGVGEPPHLRRLAGVVRDRHRAGDVAGAGRRRPERRRR